MRQFGLIGFPLSHSFSKKYFSEKFQKENIVECDYELFELSTLGDFKAWMNAVPNLRGLNVTIPYKQDVMPFLDRLDPKAKEIGAVNVIRKESNGEYVGYNSDYFGFKTSVSNFLSGALPKKALVLGTGGASKAVIVALRDLGIECQYVSRIAGANSIAYADITSDLFREHKLIVNTTPLGMHPKVEECPAIPYELLDSTFYLYDLVYNPAETLFMKKGLEKGAKVINGLDMLISQAEKAWEIWN
jgi:shikimate dehydrogenase